MNLFLLLSVAGSAGAGCRNSQEVRLTGPRCRWLVGGGGGGCSRGRCIAVGRTDGRTDCRRSLQQRRSSDDRWGGRATAACIVAPVGVRKSGEGGSLRERREQELFSRSLTSLHLSGICAAGAFPAAVCSRPRLHHRLHSIDSSLQLLLSLAGSCLCSVTISNERFLCYRTPRICSLD